jgi:hypothetical protein
MTVRPSRPIRSPACMKPARNATAIDTVFARAARITAVSMWASVLRCRCPSGGGLQRHLGQHGTLIKKGLVYAPEHGHVAYTVPRMAGLDFDMPTICEVYPPAPLPVGARWPVTAWFSCWQISCSGTSS